VKVESGQHVEPNDRLDGPPSMAYKAYFLLVMALLSASVVGERYMMVVMVEPIRRELHLTDTSIALVKDLAIVLVYIIAVIPLARLADRTSKRRIVAIAAVVWSAAVFVCGLAKGFWMLLIGRAGIGLGEGGFTPPSQSWIADLFPIKQRATALSLFLLGASLGTFAGPAFGGWASHEYGWRTAMVLASVPGFILAPIVWLTLRDVPPGFADGQHKQHPAPPSFAQTARELLAIKTLPPFVLATAFTSLLTLGLVSWTPAFMARTHGMSPRDAGIQMGSALFVGSVIGHSVGGPLSDWLGRRDLRWYIWTMMISAGLASIVAFVMLTGPAAYVFPLIGLNMFIGGLSAAPMMTVVTGLAPAHSRSMAVAVMMVAINVIGLGGGPLVVGMLSDILNPVYGEDALGVAMKIILVVGIPSTILTWIASRYCVKDFAAAGILAANSATRPSLGH
jgi:predicted MFS family arabinose efflux permease